MQFKDIPIEVEQVAVRTRDRKGCVTVKLALFLGGDEPAARELRRYFIDEVLPRPEIGRPVSLEGLDGIPSEERTPEESLRLDLLMRRASQKIKINCAPPKAWWERVRISLWTLEPGKRSEDDMPLVALYPAQIDGKVSVEVENEAFVASMSWQCLAELAEVAPVAKVAELLDMGAWLDLSFDAAQLELNLGEPDPLKQAAADFRKAVSDLGEGTTVRVTAGGRKIDLQ